MLCSANVLCVVAAFRLNSHRSYPVWQRWQPLLRCQLSPRPARSSEFHCLSASLSPPRTNIHFTLPISSESITVPRPTTMSFMEVTGEGRVVHTNEERWLVRALVEFNMPQPYGTVLNWLIHVLLTICWTEIQSCIIWLLFSTKIFL